jgi:hypothetical protein
MDDSAVKPFAVFRYMHLVGNVVDMKQKRLIMFDLFINFFLERLQIISFKKFNFIFDEIKRNLHRSSLLSPPSVTDFDVIIYWERGKHLRLLSQARLLAWENNE